MSERICYDCTHLSADYEPDWSDVTPGNGLTLRCEKNHWEIGSGRWSGDGLSRETLRRSLKMAPTCADFKLAEER
jgi:hypothetical protein